MSFTALVGAARLVITGLPPSLVSSDSAPSPESHGKLGP
jgi:hypothetical protein